MTSQFTGYQPNLSNFIDKKGFYPAGRLDKDSEGLLLLTNDGRLQARIAHPKFKMPKTYLVQVEGLVSSEALNLLRSGLRLKDGLTSPAIARRLEGKVEAERNPPIRVRANRETSWIEITIKEGRNRQVRRMTAATGFPTLRLLRCRVGPWHLNQIKPGEYCEEQVNLPNR